jgi:hypothetical protein
MDEIIEKQLEAIKLIKDKQPKMSVEEAKLILQMFSNWCIW